MTATEHVTEAERLLGLAARFVGKPSADHEQYARMAQIHATLALALNAAPPLHYLTIPNNA